MQWGGHLLRRGPGRFSVQGAPVWGCTIRTETKQREGMAVGTPGRNTLVKNDVFEPWKWIWHTLGTSEIGDWWIREKV